MNRLDEIEARANAATEGPWNADGFADGDTISLDVYAPGAAHAVARDIRSHSDADFIAHARTDVPALVGALRAVLAALPEPSDENPFMYDPWDDDSVDPSNSGDVVHAAVSKGWDAGAVSLSNEVRAAITSALEES